MAPRSRPILAYWNLKATGCVHGHETPLAVPVQLVAGHTYRLGFFTAGNQAYGSYGLASDYADATLHQAYLAGGDAFPNSPDVIHYALVDIRYAVGIPAPMAVSPTNTGPFAIQNQFESS